MRARLVAAALGVAVLAAPSATHAMDAEVTGDVAAQFYDVRSPTGENILLRRRLTTTLGVSAYDLVDRAEGDVMAPELSFRARVRYDADYGVNSGEVTPSNAGSFVPGVSQGLVDLMYAYVEGRRFFKGWMGFKLGRQYVTDALGWWSFDGAEVSATTPYFLKAEVYGGFEQRGGMPLSTSRYETDGVWRGDRSGFDPSTAPAFQPAALAPAVGVALESTGVTWLHGRLTYRRVYDTGASNLTEFASGTYAPAQYTGGRISSEKVGYSVDANAPNLGGVKAGIVYDVYDTEVSNIYATVDAYAGKKVTLSADYDYYVPTFDADSIWNFFAGEPMNDVGLRANVNATDHLSVAGGAHVRVFNVQTSDMNPGGGAAYAPYPNFAGNLYPSNGHPFDEGGNLSARWRRGATLVTLRGSGSFGDEGDRVGADVYAQHVFENRYITSLRTGVWNWDDKLEPDRSATSVNYVAGLGYRFADRTKAIVEWEQDINGVVGNRFRLMVWFTVAVSK
ncbi:MAG TPA: hypothetical protein VGG39_15040 [Polyangiaceae bacterium]|jgi:hypothetical protein